MPSSIDIHVKLLYTTSKIPTQGFKNDAGFDCYVHHFVDIDPNTKKIVHLLKDEKSTEHEWVLKPNSIIGCALGFATELPKGYYATLVPRSGLAIKHGITIVNTPATIDEGYRGEWVCIVGNLSSSNYTINIDDKICQLIPKKMIPTNLVSVQNFYETERGEKGFGSSGK